METIQAPTYCETVPTALTVKGAPAWLHLYLTSQGKDAVFLPVPQDGLCTNARTRKNRAYQKSPLFILPRGHPTVPSDQDFGYTFPNKASSPDSLEVSTSNQWCFWILCSGQCCASSSMSALMKHESSVQLTWSWRTLQPNMCWSTGYTPSKEAGWLVWYSKMCSLE